MKPNLGKNVTNISPWTLSFRTERARTSRYATHFIIKVRLVILESFSLSLFLSLFARYSSRASEQRELASSPSPSPIGKVNPIDFLRSRAERLTPGQNYSLFTLDTAQQRIILTTTTFFDDITIPGRVFVRGRRGEVSRTRQEERWVTFRGEEKEERKSVFD